MTRIHRLLDANANRAREALRVLEDAARFLLDDAETAGKLKALRHELSETLSTNPGTRGVAERDTRGDVGTRIAATGEYERTSPREVVAAAGKRLGEALRVLEEFSKIGSESTAATIESIRYRAYDLEASLVLALSAAGRQWRLCVLLTEALCTHMDWREVARAAVAGGADCLQLREKDLLDGDLLNRARVLVDLVADDAEVIINDRIDIALLSGADGVHLGQDDLTVRDARRLAGNTLIVGLSTSSVEQAHAAVRSGADYIGVGPMFPTTTKFKEDLAGPEYLAQLEASDPPFNTPYLAIGGITPDNMAPLAEVGCRGVAVSSAVCGARDPEAVCRDLIAGLRRPTPA